MLLQNNHNKTTQLIRANFELPYKIQGTGNPILIIGDCTYYPKTFSNHFKEHFKLHFITHRGFSKNATNQNINAFTLETILEDIHKFQLMFGFTKIILMGHSIHH